MKYMAPEILLKQEYTKAVDIWSAGVVMYMLISGEHPLGYKGSAEKFIDDLKARTKIEYKKDQGFTDLGIDLLS